MNHIEQEVKYLITKEDYRLAVEGYAGEVQINHYFLCGDSFKKNVVRIRVKNDIYELTIKVKKEIIDDTITSFEYNQIITKTDAQKYIATGICANVLNGLFGLALPNDMHFNFIGSLVTHRTKIEKSGMLLELDKNEYLGHIDYEIECECATNIEIEKVKNYIKQNFSANTSQPKIIRFIKRLYEIKER